MFEGSVTVLMSPVELLVVFAMGSYSFSLKNCLPIVSVRNFYKSNTDLTSW